MIDYEISMFRSHSFIIFFFKDINIISFWKCQMILIVFNACTVLSGQDRHLVVVNILKDSVRVDSFNYFQAKHCRGNLLNLKVSV